MSKQDEQFKRWIRERILVWSLIIVGVIVTIIWGTMSKAAETGPVNEGDWHVPNTAISICPAFVTEADPNFCVFITDNWGPYPTEKRCNDRIEQMAEVFPGILTIHSGIPHWSLVSGSCEKEGVDA